MEPAAAAVAAAPWCLAAADVVLGRGGWDDLDDLVAAADAAEPLDVETPRVALGRMRDGASPLAVVRCLVEPALLAGPGVLLAAPEPICTLLDLADPARCLLGRLPRMIEVLCVLYAGDAARLRPGREAARTATRLDDTTPVSTAP